MKYTLFLVVLLWWVNLQSQPWYSHLHNPFNGQEVAKAMAISGDSIFIRANNICSEQNYLCSIVGIYSIAQNEFTNLTADENIQGGTKNLMIVSDHISLSSQESEYNASLRLNIIDRSSLSFIDSLNLRIDSTKYFSYTVSTSLRYFDNIIVGGNILDSSKFINYPGWFNYRENAVIFSLNLNYDIDSILVIQPSSGAFLKIEDMAVGPDSLLYISFFEKYLKHGASEDYLEIRKVIYGYDKHFTKVFQWIGPDFIAEESLSCLVIGPDSTIYVNYQRDYQSFLAALRSDGTVKWEIPFDSEIGVNLYNIRRLLLTENGDILGVGVISSAIDELGESGFLFRAASNGTLRWKRAIRINKGLDFTLPPEFPFRSGLEDVQEVENGDLIATGYVRKYVGHDHPDGPYNFDIWMLRTNGEGCIWKDCPYIQDIVSKDQYIRLVSSNNEWVVDVALPNQPTIIQRFSFDPDSVSSNDMVYYEMIYTPTIQSSWQETGRFMREESGKVYELLGDSSEILLYDFNLQTGDSMAVPHLGTNNIRKVIDVETSNLADDIPRKSISLICNSDITPLDTTIWIEGLGDSERFFWAKTFCSEEDTVIRNLRCFLSNKQVLYSKPGLEGCYITAVDDPDKGSVVVFPNPAINTLHFEIDDNLIVDRILLYNSLGQLVLSTDQSYFDNTMDISKLPAGIYYGSIYFQERASKKFKVFIL